VLNFPKNAARELLKISKNCQQSDPKLVHYPFAMLLAKPLFDRFQIFVPPEVCIVVFSALACWGRPEQVQLQVQVQEEAMEEAMESLEAA
jgi:hypothetical protein